MERSTQFLARDSICLVRYNVSSVCLSVTHVDQSIQCSVVHSMVAPSL